MGTDYHTDVPISIRPNPVDLAWLDEYRTLHGLSRNSVFNQALASFRMAGEGAGWNAAELLDMLRVVVEALDIPDAACVGDEEIRRPILDDRTGVMLTSLKLMLDRGPDQADVAWTAGYVRERLAQTPATGYRTDYAEVIADREGITVESARAQLTAGGDAFRSARAAGADFSEAMAAQTAAVAAVVEAGQ